MDATDLTGGYDIALDYAAKPGSDSPNIEATVPGQQVVRQHESPHTDVWG